MEETSGYVHSGSELIIFSNKGKDWNGKKLNEENLLSNQLVMWENYFYKTGNRRHNLVELYQIGRIKEFVRTVDVDSICLCKLKEDPSRDSKLRKILKKCGYS